MSGQAKPGWFTPEGGDEMRERRYWDGTAWTNHAVKVAGADLRGQQLRPTEAKVAAARLEIAVKRAEADRVAAEQRAVWVTLRNSGNVIETGVLIQLLACVRAEIGELDAELLQFEFDRDELLVIALGPHEVATQAPRSKAARRPGLARTTRRHAFIPDESRIGAVAIAWAPYTDCDGDGPVTMQLRGDSNIQLAGFLESNLGDADEVSIAVDDGQVIFTLSTGKTFTEANDESTFPRWRDLIPDEAFASPDTIVPMGAGWLESVDIHRGDNYRVWFATERDHGAVVVDADGRKRTVENCGLFTDEVKAQAWAAHKTQHGERCECGATLVPGVNIAYDHKHPWSRGGGNQLANCKVLCRSCNASKGSRV